MIVIFNNRGQAYDCDLTNGKSLAINLDFANGNQPNFFGAPKATAKPLATGGSCNVEQISLTPHCNGTHTETVAHIVTRGPAIASVLNQALVPALVVSLQSEEAADSSESYQPLSKPTDQVITAAVLEAALVETLDFDADALIIRTLPNDDSKLNATDANPESIPYFTNDAMRLIVNSGIKHLLVDLPSVDRLDDDGLLSNHRIFWNVKLKSQQLDPGSHVAHTITELIYVSDSIVDGPCLVSIQVPAFESDAASSRPIVYAIEKKNQG